MNPIVLEDICNLVAQPLPWENFAGATVLISGASGFLPAYMAETLLFLNREVLSRPARVVALVRNLERARARFAPYADRGDLEFLVQDVSEPLKDSRRFDYIVHAASQASATYYKTDPVGTLSANVLGTHHLLNAAKPGCRGFLFFSSGEVYGNVVEGPPVMDERRGGFLDPADVRSCYGEGKRAGETMCAAWAQQFGVPTRMVRISHTYGPGMRLDDGRVFADFVRDILNGGPIVLLSDGRARRPFCYLADATAGFFTVLLKGENGQPYNLANPECDTSIGDLAERLARLFAAEGIVVDRRVRDDSAGMENKVPVSRVPSIEKIKALGWEPKTSIEAGFERTVRSFREAGK